MGGSCSRVWRWLGVAFQRAGDAVAAAIEAQRALVGERWPEGIELRVRMGLHTGEAEERDGDYFGPPVNRAARLMGAGHGGEILVSATTAEMLWSLSGVELVDAGLLELRGVSDPVHAFGVSAEGIPWLDRQPSTARTAVGNLPAPVDEWFGSVADLHRRVADLPRRRLVTLTGTGGVGKTRYALEMAAIAVDEFRDGVWLVELAPLAEPESVVLAVASMLSIRPQGGMTAVEAIADWLYGRRLLLILDNCEHVLTAVADVASAIVTRCPTVTVLATSREPLGVAGERVVPLTGLGTAEAVGLFCDRVMAVDDTVTVSADDERAVVSICEDLDGIPLAIELAAARVRSMTPTEVLERLGDGLRLLRSSGRGRLARHRTLHAAVDWSYQLLPADERSLFDRLSVFVGGFDLPAVETICAGPPLDAAEILDLLAGLVDKSMVIADRGAGGTRYRLLETLRQFAAARLADAGGLDQLRVRHLRHYLDVAEEAKRLCASRHQLAGHGSFDREWDNLRAAHAWAVGAANIHAADRIVATTRFHAKARSRHEHADWAARTLELEAVGLTPASATYAAAAHDNLQTGDHEACIRLAERGIRAAPWPDHPGAAGCWSVTIIAHLHAGREGAAAVAANHLAVIEKALTDPLDGWLAVQGLIENAIANDRAAVPGLVDTLSERAGKIGAPTALSDTARYRALSALYAEDPRDPERAFTASHTGVLLARTVGDLSTECSNLSVLAMAAVALHRTGAKEICCNAVSQSYDCRMWHVLWLVIETVAGYFAAHGSVQDAAVLYGHLDAHRTPFGIPGVRRARQRGLDRVRQLPNFDLLMAQGAAKDRHELVAYILDRLGRTASSGIGP